MELSDRVEAFEGGSWIPKSRTVSLSSYSAVVFEFMRNEPAPPVETPTNYAAGWEKILERASASVPRVIAGNCPPQARPDLTGWDSDLVTTGSPSFRDAIRPYVFAWSVPMVDNYSRFLDLVAAGKYTVGQLMGDIYHPSTPVGFRELADTITPLLLSGAHPERQAPIIQGSVVTYLWGKSISGTWVVAPVTPGDEVPRSSPLGRIAGAEEQANLGSTIGARLGFPDFVSQGDSGQVWLTYWGGGTPCILDAYVDRGTTRQRLRNLSTNGAVDTYPHSVLIAGDLGAGRHAVELETADVTGPCRIIGVTYAGAQ
jgi:hypothetical protein